MANTRDLSWAAALRELKDDRLKREPIREERLRTTAGLRGSPAIALSAWRGASGKRYVVGVHDLITLTLEDAGAVVALAVRRDASGIAHLVAVRSFYDCTPTPVCRAWITNARTHGATEMHLHRLAGGDDGRAATVADLTEDEPALQPAA